MFYKFYEYTILALSQRFVANRTILPIYIPLLPSHTVQHTPRSSLKHGLRNLPDSNFQSCTRSSHGMRQYTNKFQMLILHKCKHSRYHHTVPRNPNPPYIQIHIGQTHPCCPCRTNSSLISISTNHCTSAILSGICQRQPRTPLRGWYFEAG